MSQINPTNKSLRVGFYVYPTAFQNPGGGEVQLLKTREYLQRLGVTVDLFNPWTDKVQDFDLVHTFGSVKDALPMMRIAKERGVPNVLSTICWYNWQSAWQAQTNLKNRLVAVARHAAKVVTPWVASERKQMMDISDMLLPNSLSEAKQLQSFFCVPENKIAVIPNAVDSHFAHALPDLFIQKFNLKDFVLCVGRIEPRKNQLGMVKALAGMEIPVVFIGNPVTGYEGYYEECKRAARPNIHFLGGLSHESGLLQSAYAACKVFLLASWLETPGLAALEAGLAGANIVITKQGATREYFGEHAGYVDPASITSIQAKTLDYFNRPKSAALSQHILQSFTWEKTAATTLAAYHKVLKPSAAF